MKQAATVLVALAMAGAAASSSAGGRATAEDLAPLWTVPRTAEPPVIDGRIDPAEWRQAVSATGLVDYLSRFLVARQAQVWLTWDAKNLYVAMRSPLPGHGKLLAKQKRNDVRWVFQDDAIEVCVKAYRNRDGEAGFEAIHQMIFNSIDTVFDIKRCKGIGQDFMNWNTQAERGNGIHDGAWHWEARIPVSDFGLPEIPADTTWRIAVVRNWKNPSSWASITPGYGCSRANTFIRAHLVKPGPVFQLTGLDSALREGRLRLTGQVVGTADAPYKVTAEITAWPKGTPILKRTATTPGGAPVQIEGDFQMAESNRLAIQVVTAGGKPLFRHRILFRAMSADERKSLEQWNAPPKPKERFVCRRYHHVAAGRLEVVVGLDNYVHAPRVTTVRARLTNAARRPVADATSRPGANATATVSLDVRSLKVGTYRLHVSAVDKAGASVETRTFPFEIKAWPWLGNQLGKSDVILPPHEPLAVDDYVVRCWGRRHTLGQDGLMKAIVSQNTQLLAAPQRLTATVNGSPVRPVVTSPWRITSGARHAVVGEAGLKIGAVPLTVALRMEYDGWSVYTLTLGATQGASVDALDMEFALPVKLATLYHVVCERHTDNLAGEIPPGKGVVWDSRVPENADILGTWKPYVWVGNEGVGLSWMADSDRGWHTDDARGCIDLVRDPKAGVVRLRFHLINLPTPMTKSRKIVFGIMATPSKPMPDGWRRWSLWDPKSPRRPNKVLGINFKRFWCHGFGGSFYPKKHDYGVVTYPQQFMANGYTHPTFYTGFGYIALNYPEVQYFKTDWLGKDFTTYSAVDRFATRKYWGNDPRAYITSGAALTDSFVDFMADCYDQLFNKTAFRAIYYDLFNPGFTGRLELGAYVRDDGQVQKATNLFRKRALLKRVATIMHDRGLEIMQIVHMTGTTLAPALSFAQIAFDAEMRTPPKGRDHMDTWTFDLLRAETMGKQYGLVPFFLQGGKRDLVGMLAAHDILECRGNSKGGMSHEYQKVLADFGVAVGYRDVAFVGYWENRDKVTTGDADVFCSYYRRPGKALFIFVNRSEKPKTIAPAIDWKAVGVSPVSCRDPQHGDRYEIGPAGGPLKLTIPRHDYRVLIVE